MSETLAQLLLRLSEAGEPAILWGRLAKPYFGPQFDWLLGARVLVEQAPASDWPVCSACECGLDARPVEAIGDRLVAMCPLDHRADAILTQDDLRSFRIESAALVAEIAHRSGFGLAPILLAEGVWELARLAGDHAVVLLLDSVTASSLDLVAIVHAHIRGTFAVLLPGSCDHSSRRRMEAVGWHTVLTLDALVSEPVAGGFAIDVQHLTPRRGEGPRLVLTIARRVLMLDGKELKLSERPFKLLELLARAAMGNGRIVAVAEIEKCLWARSVAPRAAADAVRDLRAKMTSVLPPGSNAADLIENRSSRGYLLNLHPSEIQIR